MDLNYDGGGLPDFSGFGQGQVTRCCEHGNEPAGYIKCGELRDYMRKWHVPNTRLHSVGQQDGHVCIGWLVSYLVNEVKVKLEFTPEQVINPQWPVCTGAENLAPNGIRSPDRPARNESLYRMSYPGPR